MKKNMFKGIIVVVMMVVAILMAIYVLSLNSKDEVENNVTIVLANGTKECAEGCTRKISNNNSQSNLYVSSSEIKIDETSILKFEEGAYHLSQVTVYKDIIITIQGFSLGHSIIIYDFDGNIIRNISKVNDNNGRLFNISIGYSDNESFDVSEDGVISFIGTKRIPGVANQYLTNSGNTIDLCEQGDDISEDEIVSGIFNFKYLNNYTFSDIKYVSTKTTVKDMKTCRENNTQTIKNSTDFISKIAETENILKNQSEYTVSYNDLTYTAYKNENNIIDNIKITYKDKQINKNMSGRALGFHTLKSYYFDKDSGLFVLTLLHAPVPATPITYILAFDTNGNIKIDDMVTYGIEVNTTENTLTYHYNIGGGVDCANPNSDPEQMYFAKISYEYSNNEIKETSKIVKTMKELPQCQ